MAESLRILGNAQLDGTGNYANVYEVAKPIGPDRAGGPIPQAVVSSIVLCETGGAIATVTIRVVPKDDISAIKHSIFFEFPLSAKQTRIVTPGITLSTEDSIEAIASTANVNIFIFGSEIK